MALKLKVRTQFPAVVSADSPVTVTKTGLSYTFGFDVTALRTALDPYYAVTNLNSLILNGATSGTITVLATAIAGANIVTLPAATDTLVGKATTDELTNKTLTSSVGKGTWTVSGTWTLPAFTLGGTVSGGGNQLNNVIIGTSTPLAGAFTTVTATSSILSSSGTAGIGYATGAGGAVTQITSRTTGVTLNKVSGAITLFTAAGSATAASFTVTNSTVAATDTISLSVKSSTTNKYNAIVTAVAAGSFEITFFTTGGTTSDAPVFNFNVVKGVAA